MERIAVFPGSFDPITVGHVDIIKRGLKIFDRIIVGIGSNAEKKYMFDLQKRETWVQQTFASESRISVVTYQGLTVDFCKKMNAGFILRGLRNSSDFEFEKAIAHMNGAISNGLETIFILTDLRYAAVSSSIIRDIIRNGGDVSAFLPETIKL
ncbi:MAG: pantetheine-phosphate adenylyltransferase [Bacteroidetes bacterium]|nr:pantetheine-phosphate adenylyltransferase [Bacteroidota bacterium]MBK9048995.1 pantetheine-phosphate adenylyltransferase [Bacteroidota bacterium]MBK9423219.1 pantetheine-phosphate adenylyltransferase [Bacteroidota bacterium]